MSLMNRWLFLYIDWCVRCYISSIVSILVEQADNAASAYFVEPTLIKDLVCECYFNSPFGMKRCCIKNRNSTVFLFDKQHDFRASQDDSLCTILY